MSDKIIYPARRLRGEIEVPGDKSISHRAVMLGSIARGTTEITHFLNGADCLSTISCFRKMGITIEERPDCVLVQGKGLRGLSAPDGALYTGNSGTTTRLLCGILAGQDFPAVLSGDASLNARPMQRIMTPLGQMGAELSSLSNNGCAPLSVTPGALHGIKYQSPVSSAQIKSAILLAGLYADGETSVTEPALSRNHTELMLQNFGAHVSSVLHVEGGATALVTPPEELYAQQVWVPGDISSAAYFIAAGLLVPNSEILVKNVGTNFTRAGFLKICEEMGGDITLLNRSFKGGESRADVLVRSSSLKGTVIEGDLIPTLIDEIPIIAVMAACAKGTTTIRDAAELKVKETNRIDTVTENLQAMGGDVTPTEDGMVIRGGPPLKSIRARSRLDHRIAMSFAVAGLIAPGETIIENGQCIDISYPEFFETLESCVER